MQYRADGTYRIAYTVEELESNPRASGRFWFEGAEFNAKDNLCPKGTYEVRVRQVDDKPAQLIFSVISDPSCHKRARDWRTPMLWVEP